GRSDGVTWSAGSPDPPGLTHPGRLQMRVGEASAQRHFPHFSTGGAGGNRTPVRQVVTEPDTTIPATRLCGYRTGGSAAPKGHRRVFPRCQRSFPPSVVFPYGPPTLLLPGCVDQAPCAVAGHDDSLTT